MTIKVTRLQVGGYTAQDDRNNNTAQLVKTAPVTAKSGILPSDGTDFAVSAQGTPNMTLNVGKGDLVVADAAGGAYVFHNDATKVVTIATAPSSGTRYDLIIARVYDNSAGDAQATSNITLPGSAGTQAVQTITGDIEVVAGTAGGSPSPPALPNTRSVVLKVVAVGTNVTSINNGNLQDSQSTTSRVGFTASAGGVLVCTSSTRPSTPYLGMVIFETDTADLKVCTNTTGPVWSIVYDDTGWTQPALGNSWTAYDATPGTTFAIPAYRRKNGVVYLEGAIKGGTSSTAIFTLPAGYRPLKLTPFLCLSAGGAASVQINVLPTGEVEVIAYGTGASNGFVGLYDIQFVAEQ